MLVVQHAGRTAEPWQDRFGDDRLNKKEQQSAPEDHGGVQRTPESEGHFPQCLIGAMMLLLTCAGT